MNISFLGAAREVGRSAILVEGKENVLLDCGIKLTKNEEFPLLDNRTVRTLDKVVLSHAHLDHCGYLPALYASGYKKKVAMTKPTRDLIQLLLADYLRLNKEGVIPYNQSDVDTLLKSTDILEYNEATKGTTPIRFSEAGHIIGSAITEVFAEKKIIYTGDLNLRTSRLLEGAQTGLEGEVLVMESTYGAKADSHTASKDVGKQLIDSINSTLKKGGKVIIPTFAIGRGQEILFTLESYMRSGGLHSCPIFLDGMVNKALRIYRHNAIYLKKEVQRRILTSDDDPFKSEFYHVPEKKDKSDVLDSGECIILCTSGMLNGGPVLRYLEALGGNRKNKMILVGYQAEGSRGRALIEGAKEIEIGGQQVEINLEVDQARFTAHSDHRDLVKFAKGIKGLKQALIVHGEPHKQDELAQAIEEHCKGVQAYAPQPGEAVVI